MRNNMEFIHDRKSNILFSLYGSKVNRIRIHNKTLTLTVDVMNEYADSEFEIITEGYYANTTTYTGWLWADEKSPVSTIMYIWNSGDMVYRVKK